MYNKPARTERAAVYVLGLGFGNYGEVIRGVTDGKALGKINALLAAADCLVFALDIQHAYGTAAFDLKLTARKGFKIFSISGQ